MGSRELLPQLRAIGLVLTLTPAGGLCVAPRSALTDDQRAAIRQARDELVQTLQAEAAILSWLATIGETDPEVIRHVLAQCAEKPDLRQYLLSLTEEASRASAHAGCGGGGGLVRQAVRQCLGRSAIHSGTRSEGHPGSILSTPVPTNLQSLREP